MNPSPETNIQTPSPIEELGATPTPLIDGLNVQYEGPLTQEDTVFEDELKANAHPTPESVASSIAQEALPQMMDKKSWHENLDSLVPKAIEKGLDLSVAFIDVNYFKEVNDLISHERGDQVIEELKKVISGVFRTSSFNGVQESERMNSETDKISLEDTQVAEYDIIGDTGHIGGDEFAIAALTNPEGMQIITQRVRDAFQIYINLPQNEDLRKLGMFESGIGLAIGSATLENGMTASELLTKADEAMYADKVEQVPELTQKQKASIWAAKVLLQEAGIRLRDLSKLDVLLGSEHFTD